MLCLFEVFRFLCVFDVIYISTLSSGAADLLSQQPEPLMLMMMMMIMLLQGTVIIIANHGERIDIPPGAILENKIVSGNLRILDH